MIRDVVVDSNNNSYYLTKIFAQNPNINGTPVTSYQDSDLLLFSLDCQGNLRWSRTIGGYGDSEQAWNLEVDNNGGLYMMVNVANAAHISAPTSALSIRWDDTHIMPITTAAYTDNTSIDPGLNRIFLLKYNTADGVLAWEKPLQNSTGVTRVTREGDNGVWTMDSNKNIHAVLGFEAGTHLGGLITVPSTYTTTYQYYLVKFINVAGDMVPQPNPILLPIEGNLGVSWNGGKVQFLYDETLQQYYLAGSTSVTFQDYIPFSYGGIPLSNDGYVLAFSVATGNPVESWRKEFTTSANGSVATSPDEKIYSLIKDTASNIYISGKYATSFTPVPTFGNTVLPTSGVGYMNFVMKMDPTGNVLWTKIPTSTTSIFGTQSKRARIALNGNEIAFVKGSRGYEIWDSFSLTNPTNDLANSLLVRLNKDTGSAVGINPILSDFGTDDELTSVAVDNDGNYVVGGYFHTQIFTDPNDNIPTQTYVGNNKSQFYVAKLAKSACTAMGTEETAVEAGLHFYPNPVQDILNIKSKNKLESFEIYSSTGQTIKRGSLQNTDAQINMSGLTTGVYYVKVKTEKAVVTEKVIKK